MSTSFDSCLTLGRVGKTIAPPTELKTKDKKNQDNNIDENKQSSGDSEHNTTSCNSEQMLDYILELDIINATNVHGNVQELRHSYFSLSREVIEDVRDILVGNNFRYVYYYKYLVSFLVETFLSCYRFTHHKSNMSGLTLEKEGWCKNEAIFLSFASLLHSLHNYNIRHMSLK